MAHTLVNLKIDLGRRLYSNVVHRYKTITVRSQISVGLDLFENISLIVEDIPRRFGLAIRGRLSLRPLGSQSRELREQ